MQKDDILELKIIDVDNNGIGVARYNNFVIFIPKVLVGEEVKVKITNIKKNYANASLIEIINDSNERVKPVCPYYNLCGGCSFLHTTYENELKIKQKYLNRILGKYKVNNIVSFDMNNYRNKVTLHVKGGKLGLYKEKTNELIEIDNCLLLDDKINEIIMHLKQIDLQKVTIIMIRVSNTTREVMVSLDNNINIDNLKKDVDSIYINNKLVYGKKYIKEVINDITYTIYPESFFQINTFMMQYLYDIIKKYCGTGNKLLDLYCGTGTIGIYLKNNYKKILGIEINESSIENAKLNKDINNIKNIDFINNDAKILKDKKYDTIIVDPPRIGLSDDVINNLLKIKSDKIIYVSCNPNTLKRDIDKLGNLYDVLEITPVNMFPKTEHVECVCVLNRR